MPYLWVLLAIALFGCSAADESPANSGSTDTSTSADSSEEGSNDAAASSEEEACLDCEDTEGSDLGVLLEEAEANEESEEQSPMLIRLRGYWAESDREGSINLRVEKEGSEEALCELNCSFESTSQNESCEACEFAWDFGLGPAAGDMENENCSLLEGICDRSHSYGHLAPDQLYTPKAGKWSAIETGLSAIEGRVWNFEYTYIHGETSSTESDQDTECYENCIAKGGSEEDCATDCKSGESPGGEDGKDPNGDTPGKDEGSENGLDESCFEACVAKGQSEEDCAGFCGGDSDTSETDDGDSSNTGVDQGCFDACVAKGASEEVCTEACSEGAGSSDGEGGGK